MLLGRWLDRVLGRGARGEDPPWMLEAVMPRVPIERLDNLAYGPLPRQRLDLYLPLAAEARRRLVVILYGGGWEAGARRAYRFLAYGLAACGLAVAVPDYRLFPEVRYPTFLEDNAAALAWLHDHVAARGVDPGRIALLGHSAGAYDAAMIALDRRYLAAHGLGPNILRGTVALAGPHAFHPQRYEGTRAIFAAVADDRDAPRPVAHVGPAAPAMQILHGLEDEIVWPVNSRLMHAALEGEGCRAELRLYPGLGHIGLLLALARPFAATRPVRGDVMRFLDEILAEDVAKPARVATRSEMSAIE